MARILADTVGLSARYVLQQTGWGRAATGSRIGVVAVVDKETWDRHVVVEWALEGPLEGHAPK
jgi:hypothetical protein